ncbi:hypothetical protein MNBD_GAMMA12-1966 [hydrothermal vent metagenome]|uniref:Uncharacterized protein n=1 Tax=hydrothermal vent metagenome TaxID=652676 RepID=A0A3B0Z6R9_9ZZZZ
MNFNDRLVKVEQGRLVCEVFYNMLGVVVQLSKKRKLNFYKVLLIVMLPLNVFAGELTLNDLYNKFNMRTIYSSYGQRLQYYCGAYPKNFFPKHQASFKFGNTLKLVSGDDVWIFTMKSDNKIILVNKITSGTYNTVNKYALHFDRINGDWRADKIRIKEPVNCKKFSFK